MNPARFFRRLCRAACILILASVLSNNAVAQSYAQQFDSYFLKEQPDTVQIHTLLRLWQRMSPEDPQLYVAAFNFYFAQSRREHGATKTPQPRTATDTASDLITEYNPQRVGTALQWINSGIARYPDRLDMWFGKAHALRLTHQFDSFLVVMRQVLARSVENRNQWQWNNGEPLASGRQAVLSTMQTYLRELYETERAALLPVMSGLGEAVIGVYPEEVEILTTTAVSLLLQKRYDAAIGYLRRAENLRPQDIVVLNNLAEAYNLKGDKPSSRRYLELVEKHGNAEERATARRRMKALRRG